ncbi:MAG: UDP-N-acetylmuramoyl-tripeptide--D-alanyl-D-alanine ligase [Actinomycetota bacterium]
MIRIEAADLARTTAGRVVGDPAAVAAAWDFDSRTVGSEGCFVALRGHRDGHDFVADAFANGATIALVERVPEGVATAAGQALVVVPDVLAALQAAATDRRRSRPDLAVLAVAGSTGKTSTKDLLAAALAALGCHANPGSFNNEFGLPLTICNAPAAARVLVTEMGERRPGDLALLCGIARPDAAIVTNVGLAHAEHLGGPEGAAAVIGELLDALPADGVAVIPADDPWGPVLAQRTAARVVTVGRSPAADYRIDEVVLDDRLRPSFTIAGTRIAVPLHGGHHAANAAAAAVGAHEALGVPFPVVADALRSTAAARWRMELLETSDGIVVLNDAYNANPTSMAAALDALAALRIDGRRIAVLGDMRELGVHHDDAHREVGERAAAAGIDLVVGVGAGGAAIAAAAAAAGVAIAVVDDASAAGDLLVDVAVPADAVLCKASRAVGLERVAERLLEGAPRAASGGGIR